MLSFRKKGVVSIWLGVGKPNRTTMAKVDVLKDWCGVDYYDLDDQEVAAIGKAYRQSRVSTILRQLSYSGTFADAAEKAAAVLGIRQAYWAIAQFDFAYDPARIRGIVAADPVFLGVFG